MNCCCWEHGILFHPIFYPHVLYHQHLRTYLIQAGQLTAVFYTKSTYKKMALPHQADLDSNKIQHGIQKHFPGIQIESEEGLPNMDSIKDGSLTQ